MPIDEDLVSLGDEIDDNMISEDCSKHPKTDGSKKKPSRKIMGPKEILLDLLEKLKNKDKLGVFVGKVDKYSVPDYRKIIRIPMYFNKMERKINKGKYRGIEQFVKDVKLLCDNAIQYNGSHSQIGKAAVSIEKHMQRLNQAAPARWTESFQHSQSKGLSFDRWIQHSCGLPTDRPLSPPKIEISKDPNVCYPPDSDSDESLPPPQEESRSSPNTFITNNTNPGFSANNNSNVQGNPINPNVNRGTNAHNPSSQGINSKPSNSLSAGPDPLPDVSTIDRTVLRKIFGNLRSLAPHHAVGLAYLRDASVILTNKIMDEQTTRDAGSTPLAAIPSVAHLRTSEHVGPSIPERRVLQARSTLGLYSTLGDTSRLFASFPNSETLANPVPVSVTCMAEEPRWETRRDRSISLEDSFKTFLFPSILDRGPIAAAGIAWYDKQLKEHEIDMENIFGIERMQQDVPIGPFCDPRLQGVDCQPEFSGGPLESLNARGGWMGVDEAAAKEVLEAMESSWGGGTGLKRMLKEREDMMNQKRE